MSERPILFSAEMVRAILAGRKTVTRRLAKSNRRDADGVIVVEHNGRSWPYNMQGDSEIWSDGCDYPIPCPYGVPGDRLWVRETWAQVPATAYRSSVDDQGSPIPHVVSPCGYYWSVYQADWERSAPSPWRPSIHMPRWASRITLEVVSVRCEWLDHITEDDAMAEGAPSVLVPPDGGSQPHKEGFIQLWENIYGPGSWGANPPVWRVGFKRVA